MSNIRNFSVWSFLAGIVTAALFAIGISFIWMHAGFSARQKPGAFETTIAHLALRTAVSEHQRSMINPVSLSPEVITEARDHFADHCATCHANNGSGHTMYGDGLNPAPPDLRLAATQNKSDGELYSIIQNGIRMTGMPAFGNPGENDAETWKLVLFLRHLPALTPTEEKAMEQANPISPSELEEKNEEDQFLQAAPTRSKGSTK